MRDTTEPTLAAFAMLMQGQSDTTIRHCLRLRAVAVAVAREMGLEHRALRDVEFAALLHDVGMFQLPEEVRGKIGTLTEAEWVHVRRHPDIGADMVGEITTLEGASDLIRCHHERWDGSGYPKGLVGKAIPLGARILAVVDAYDVICSDRDGSSARPPEDALGELRDHAGTQFDPAVVAAFERAQPTFETPTT